MSHKGGFVRPGISLKNILLPQGLSKNIRAKRVIPAAVGKLFSDTISIFQSNTSVFTVPASFALLLISAMQIANRGFSKFSSLPFKIILFFVILGPIVIVVLVRSWKQKIK